MSVLITAHSDHGHLLVQTIVGPYGIIQTSGVILLNVYTNKWMDISLPSSQVSDIRISLPYRWVVVCTPSRFANYTGKKFFGMSIFCGICHRLTILLTLFYFPILCDILIFCVF